MSNEAKPYRHVDRIAELEAENKKLLETNYIENQRWLTGELAKAERERDEARAENARLREGLQDCRKTIASPNPGICCTVWFDHGETLLDRIDHVLGTLSLP